MIKFLKKQWEKVTKAAALPKKKIGLMMAFDASFYILTFIICRLLFPRYLNFLYRRYPEYTQVDPAKIIMGSKDLAEVTLRGAQHLLWMTIIGLIITFLVILVIYAISRAYVYNTLAGKQVDKITNLKMSGIMLFWVLCWIALFVLCIVLIKRPLLPLIAIIWALFFLHFTQILLSLSTHDKSLRLIKKVFVIGTKKIHYFLGAYLVATIVLIIPLIVLSILSFIPYVIFVKILIILGFFAYMAWLRSYLYIVVNEVK